MFQACLGIEPTDKRANMLSSATMIRHLATCQCGQLCVKCNGEAARISMCHCLACQRRTGAPFSANSRFKRKQVTIEGRSTVYSREADSGNSVSCHFCPTCGSTVYWELSGFPDLIAVAQGMFANPSYPPPTVSVWDETRHSWTDRIGELPMEHFPRAP